MLQRMEIQKMWSTIWSKIKAFWQLISLVIKIFVYSAHSGSSIDYTVPPSSLDCGLWPLTVASLFFFLVCWHACLSVCSLIGIGRINGVFEGNDSMWRYCEKVAKKSFKCSEHKLAP